MRTFSNLISKCFYLVRIDLILLRFVYISMSFCVLMVRGDVFCVLRVRGCFCILCIDDKGDIFVLRIRGCFCILCIEDKGMFLYFVY